MIDVNFEDLEKNAEEAARLLTNMAHPKRLMVLCRLVQSECTVGELAEAVNLSQSALSQHLAKMRASNLVSTRRSAQTIYYTLASVEVESVLQTLYGLYCAPQEKA